MKFLMGRDMGKKKRRITKEVPKELNKPSHSVPSIKVTICAMEKIFR